MKRRMLEVHPTHKKLEKIFELMARLKISFTHLPYGDGISIADGDRPNEEWVIVDSENGDDPGILPPEIAFKVVTDVDPEIALTEHGHPKKLEPEPIVGMGATRVWFTDRDPYTVIEVSPSGKRCKVQSDKYVRIDTNGMSECQTYDYSPDSDGSVFELRRTKRGWTHKGSLFAMGTRRKYHDFSF